ncbi:hypothetical protein GCM10010430_51340 [Kitasatospora cystarginea]|uniref:Uncharacterized protein n=1 Tax=Kitasatospora cystarginea TaxID=58350 RepID=A0ABP5RG08_9ACTN
MPIAEDPEPHPTSDSPNGSGADDPFDRLVLDDEFVKAATIKERSGRSRVLAARWKRQPPPESQPWRPPTELRRRRFGRKRKTVSPWGVERRRSRDWQTPLFVVLAGALVVAGLNVDRLHGWYTSNVADGPTEAPETAVPTAAPPTLAPDTPTADHPWAGSPAAVWPSGADAIVLPQAQAVGVFDQDEVAAQLKTVKDFLVAANLDPKTLAGGTPQAALDLLGGKSREEAEDGLAHPGGTSDPSDWASRFNPRTAIPAGDVVKLQGRTSFEADGKDGMVVHTDYTFVYAVLPGPDAGKLTPSPSQDPAPSGLAAGATPGAEPAVWTGAVSGSTEVTREIVRRVIDFRFYDPAKYDVEPGKLNFSHTNSYFGNSLCGVHDGWLEPDFPVVTSDGTEPRDGGTMDPYNRSKPLPDGTGKCGTVTRT